MVNISDGTLTWK